MTLARRPVPLYLADAMIRVELVDEREQKRFPDRDATRYTLDVAAEQRGGGRLVTFPAVTLAYDDHDNVIGANLATGPAGGKSPICGEWLVNDGVCGTLPLVAFSQRAARQLADEFLSAVHTDVLDQTPGQVFGWCEWWSRKNAAGCRLLTTWPSARVLPQPPQVDHVTGTLDVHQAPEADERGLFDPAVQPDPAAIPDQAPALVQTLKNAEAVN